MDTQKERQEKEGKEMMRQTVQNGADATKPDASQLTVDLRLRERIAADLEVVCKDLWPGSGVGPVGRLY